MSETTSERATAGKTKKGAGLRMQRVFTTAGVHPYDAVTWERRDVVMKNWRDDTVNFEQYGVEFPDFWSVNATNIVTTKYFRGAESLGNRESSLRQVVDRVVDTYVAAGIAHGYFATPQDAEIFDHELKHALIHQVFSFNSPVWFNVGTTSPQQVSACFILSVDDTMDSILNWYKEEGIIFKGGSGAGLNLSRIRASKELLSSGGTASGPVSFMRGADASAGTIKSGGATRRAAKMVILDVDHPDIEEFIETKAREEDKIRVLRDAGFDMDLGGKDIVSVQYQNANNSVRVTDDFMRAVEANAEFHLRARKGEQTWPVDAKTLYRKIAQAAWECADPGIQYDDTINDWHTCPESGRITASNPCFPADQRVVTDRGLVRIGDLVEQAATGETFAVYTNDVTNEDAPANVVEATIPTQYMVTGTKEVLELRFTDGSRLRCTPNHRVWTDNGWVRAEDLTDSDKVMKSLVHAPRSSASPALPEAAQTIARRAAKLNLPEKWDDGLAHFLGWLTGDGCVSGVTATTVYGTDADRADVMPRHQALLASLTGFDAKPSLQANGTIQLRSSKKAVVDFLTALGVTAGTAKDKVVPEAIHTAPEDILVTFLQGLFDADGTVVNQSNGTRYVGLGSRSEELVLGVQELLASLGIRSRIYSHEKQGDSFTYTRKDGSEASYGSTGRAYDLRITGRSLREYAARISFSLQPKRQRLLDIVDLTTSYDVDETVRLVSRESRGFETTYNLTEPRNHSYVVSGIVVANCSEYMHLDNSSCNLASLNLMKFRREDGTFDTKLFAKVTELVITAMDISICFADFPTEKIAETTRAYRQLGIGYANLGALLMADGMAYDSDGGRAMAGAITSLMQATAYKRSAELAGVVGPYEGYARNADAHKRVIRKHAAANDGLRPVGADDARILHEATKAWQECIALGEKQGYRNSQASVIAPTGTIGLMMDCDTTGLEPDLALVKMKKLVGGASMKIVNQTVPMALRKLGYNEETVEAIVEYIAEQGHVVDAPGLKAEHYSVFDCAMGERSISWQGHIRMMGAIQPFISGALSKTVNLPEDATIEDIEDAYTLGWKLGLKAIAVYRNACKVGQPLSDMNDTKKAAAASLAAAAGPEVKPIRKRLPKKRPSQTVSFSVGGAEGYMTAGSYPDDGLGEVFLKLGKQGSTLAGVMDAFSIAISIALQYGVPLETYVSKFTNMRFDPAGMTDDPDVRMAQSVMDYVFRRLALDYLPYDKRAELGIFTADERAAAVSGSYGAAAPVVDGPDADDLEALAQGVPIEPTTSSSGDDGGVEVTLQTAQDAPLCMNCGIKMRPAGSCYVCESCGSTSGCS